MLHSVAKLQSRTTTTLADKEKEFRRLQEELADSIIAMRTCRSNQSQVDDETMQRDGY